MKPNKWSWMMDYCKENGMSPARVGAWKKAAEAYEEKFENEVCDHVYGAIVKNSKYPMLLMYNSEREREFVSVRFKYCPLCGQIAEGE